MQSAFVLQMDKQTPNGFSTIEHENLKLREENRQLKEENEKLRENLKNLIFHSDEMSKLLKNISLESQVRENSEMSIFKKNPYEEYENRPVRSHLAMNHEWDWENKPIKPTSILINQSSTNYQRRRSKSVCFGERNLIHELIEIDNNRTPNDCTVEFEKSDLKENKRLDSSEEEHFRIEKPSKKAKSNKVASNLTTARVASKINIQPPKYNLDTSSESNQNDSKTDLPNEKPIILSNNKCNCSGDCLTNRCKCKKSKNGCNSRCHNGNPCKNC